MSEQSGGGPITRELDPETARELEAMRTVHQALLPLSRGARKRVNAWVTDRILTDDEKRDALRKQIEAESKEVSHGSKEVSHG